MILSRPTALLLSLLCATAAHAISAGPEVPLASPVIEPAPFSRGNARVASNGRDFLAVWNDRRGDSFVADVVAARIDGEGRVVDRTGIVLGPGAGNPPSVASDGRDFVVAYNCSRGGFAPATCLARIDAETGEVRRGAELPNAVRPVIASNGAGYLVAYGTSATYASTQFVEVVALDSDAAVAGTPVRIAASPYPPSLASNGETYFLVWNTYGYLDGVLVRGDGTPAPVRRIAPEAASWGPGQFSWSAGSDGTDYLVVWQQNVGVVNQGYVTELRARTISREGEPAAQHTLFGDRSQSTWDPAVAWTGSSYVVTYALTKSGAGAPGMPRSSDGDIHRMLVTRTAEVSDAPAVVAGRAGREAFAATASGGGGTLVVWEHEQPSGFGSQIEARLLGRSEPFVVSQSVTWQESITGGTAGSRRVFAWEEIAGEEQRRKVFVQRVDERPLDGRGIAVDETAADEVEPVIGGSIVAWLRQEKVGPGTATVLAKRFDASGALLDRSPIVIGEALRDTRVAVAAIGAVHLIAWRTPANTIAAVRLAGSGGPEPIEISKTNSVERDPVIATDGNSFVIAWHRELPGGVCLVTCNFPTTVYAVRVLPFGVVAGPPVAIAAASRKLRSLVWNGSEYVAFLVADGPSDVVEAQRIGRNLEVVELPRSMNVTGSLASVIWTGSDYVFAASFIGASHLATGRIDRHFTLTERVIVTRTWRPGTPVVLLPGLIAYQETGRELVSRAVMRALTDESATRRRAVR
jgi:hypothetical protein